VVNVIYLVVLLCNYDFGSLSLMH